MHQLFIRFPEFVEFLFLSGKTQLNLASSPAEIMFLVQLGFGVQITFCIISNHNNSIYKLVETAQRCQRCLGSLPSRDNILDFFPFSCNSVSIESKANCGKTQMCPFTLNAAHRNANNHVFLFEFAEFFKLDSIFWAQVVS